MYKKVRELAKKLKVKLTATGGVKDSVINKQEQNIVGVNFGSQYTTFLKEFGCLTVGHLEFYGICGKASKAPNAVYMTLQTRKHLPAFPKNLLVVYEEGSGAFVAIDKNDVVYNCTASSYTKTKGKFKDFLLKKVKALKK